MRARGLTGTKVGCQHGQRGACTVHLGGVARLSCLTLAAQVDGAEVTTIEGLADAAAREGLATEDGLHPLQAAFVEHDGFQCGYRTPGPIVSGAAVIAGGRAGGPEAVREWMSGTLCRCGAHPGIKAAVLNAAERIGAPQQARADYHLGLLERTGRAAVSGDPTNWSGLLPHLKVLPSATGGGGAGATGA